jgi:hypothetical protein
MRRPPAGCYAPYRRWARIGGPTVKAARAAVLHERTTGHDATGIGLTLVVLRLARVGSLRVDPQLADGLHELLAIRGAGEA